MQLFPLDRKEVGWKMRRVYAALITLLITSQASSLALPAQAQVQYGSVGGWNIQINQSGACVLEALFEWGGSLVYGYLDRYEGIIYADWSWKLPNKSRHPIELIFSEKIRIPVVGRTFVSAGISGIEIPFQNARLIALFRSASDLQIFSRESGKLIAHIALKDSNKAYASWRRCVDMHQS